MNWPTVIEALAERMFQNAMLFWKKNCMGRDEFRAKVEAYWEVASTLRIEPAVELCLRQKMANATQNIARTGNPDMSVRLMIHGINIGCPNVSRCIETNCRDIATNTYGNLCRLHEHLVY